MKRYSANQFLRLQDKYESAEEIREWLRNHEAWPTADSYDPDTMFPCAVLSEREQALREQVPEWFWEGAEGASILSIGTGKGYFERKYWKSFDKIYVVDPSDSTHRSLKTLPAPNCEFLGYSLFDVPVHLNVVPRYGWMGASSHYLFGEFYGWSYMQKIAMMVSDTLVIDGGVFDSDTAQGQYLLSLWRSEEVVGNEPFENNRRLHFNYQSFLNQTSSLWQVVSARSSPWIEGRHTLVLKRKLPPVIQKSALGKMELLFDRQDKPTDNWKIYRTDFGYYKESFHSGSLLIYDVVSKVMGWTRMIPFIVYDQDHYCGFVVKDYGDHRPELAEVSERLFLNLLNWSLPLGLMPADVARDNIRIHDGCPVWIDIMLAGLREYTAFLAIWSATCTYKQYDQIPDHANEMLRFNR